MSKDIVYQSKGALVAFLEEMGFQTGSSDVQASGTPLNNELAVWTDASTIEGDSALTYNNGYLTVDPDSNVYATLGKYTDTNTEFARLRLRANKKGNAVNAWIDARDSTTRSGLQLGTISDHAIYFYQNDGIVMQINDNRNVEITASIRGSYASSTNDANLVIHNAWDDGGRISFTNTADTSGPYGNSWDWTIYGDSAAEDSQADADLHFFYGDANGGGSGANILTIQGDKKVGINDSSPSYPLDVNGDAQFNAEVRLPGIPSGDYNNISIGGTSNRLYEDASTRKAKTNILYDNIPGLDVVLSLKAASFDFLSGEQDNMIGLIAEDVGGIDERLVHLGPDYTRNEFGNRVREIIEDEGGTKKPGDYLLDSDEIVPLSVNKTAVVAALVKSIQELKAEKDALQLRIEQLEAGV